MRQIVAFITLWVLLGNLIYCCKKDYPPARNIVSTVITVPKTDTVSPDRTYRDDVPPPPRADA